VSGESSTFSSGILPVFSLVTEDGAVIFADNPGGRAVSAFLFGSSDVSGWLNGLLFCRIFFS